MRGIWKIITILLQIIFASEPLGEGAVVRFVIGNIDADDDDDDDDDIDSAWYCKSHSVHFHFVEKSKILG